MNLEYSNIRMRKLQGLLQDLEHPATLEQKELNESRMRFSGFVMYFHTGKYIHSARKDIKYTYWL